MEGFVLSVYQDHLSLGQTVFLAFETVYHVQMISLVKNVLITLILIQCQKLVKINQQQQFPKIVEKTKL